MWKKNMTKYKCKECGAEFTNRIDLARHDCIDYLDEQELEMLK